MYITNNKKSLPSDSKRQIKIYFLVDLIFTDYSQNPFEIINIFILY